MSNTMQERNRKTNLEFEIWNLEFISAVAVLYVEAGLPADVSDLDSDYSVSVRDFDSGCSASARGFGFDSGFVRADVVVAACFVAAGAVVVVYFVVDDSDFAAASVEENAAAADFVVRMDSDSRSKVLFSFSSSCCVCSDRNG
jgi:hypothetical protein